MYIAIVSLSRINFFFNFLSFIFGSNFEKLGPTYLEFAK